jgi:hypothetical protein
MSLAPYDSIRALYVAENLPLSWEELVGWHLADPLGYVIKEPDFFIMGRAVVKSAGEDNIRDFRVRFPAASCDAWFLYAFAGDMTKAMDRLIDKTHHREWIAWERFNRTDKCLSWHKTARIRQQLAKPNGL